ncbi:MAG: glycosyltransferase [Planctomycetota bacterium]
MLHVNDYRSAGGCEVVVERLMEHLAARGHEVGRFTSEDVTSHSRTALGYLNGSRCRSALEDRIRTFRPDVVHLHNFYHELSPAILPAARAASRVVMTAHDFHLVCPNAGMQRIVDGRQEPLAPPRVDGLGLLLGSRWDHRGFGYSTLKLAQHVLHYRLLRHHSLIDVVLGPSRFTTSVLADHGLPAVHLSNPRPDLPRVSASRPARLRLVFAGRLEPEKGVAEFLELLPEAFGGEIEIVGDGSDRGRCETIVERRSLGDRVTFAGHLSSTDAVERIAAAHVLVLPSLWYENQPVCLLEAISLGTNILTTNLGGMAEIVEDAGTGWTFAPGDGAGLKAALDEIAAAHANDTLNHFDVSPLLDACAADVVVDRLVEIYATG